MINGSENVWQISAKTMGLKGEEEILGSKLTLTQWSCTGACSLQLTFED